MGYVIASGYLVQFTIVLENYNFLKVILGNPSFLSPPTRLTSDEHGPCFNSYPNIDLHIPIWLVVSSIFLCSISIHFIYGMSSFSLTNSYFSRCLKPPTRIYIYIYPLTTINHHLKPPTSINPQWSHDQETRTACSLQVDEQSPGGLRAALGIYYSFLFKKYVYSLYIYVYIIFNIYVNIHIYIYMIHNYINIYTHVYIFCVVSFGTPI